MAQAAMAAASSHDEDSSESRMVVTFLMSALESMVSLHLFISFGPFLSPQWVPRVAKIILLHFVLTATLCSKST